MCVTKPRLFFEPGRRCSFSQEFRNWKNLLVVLVLEDPGGVPLHQLLDSGRDASSQLSGGEQLLDVATTLRLAISFSAAIGALYKRGVFGCETYHFEFSARKDGAKASG
jgi:hypothetical protein